MSRGLSQAPEFELVVRLLRELARSRQRQYAAVTVTADGRVAVELFGTSTHQTVERYDFDERDAFKGVPLFAYPTNRSEP